MNIPESSIRPFEPHGIPKLYLDNNAGRDALRHLFEEVEQLCDKSAALSLSGIRYLIKNRLAFAGAETISIKIDGPYIYNPTPHCKITVLYKMSGGRLRGSHTALRHTAGFRK